MPAPLWTPDQRFMRDAPLESGIHLQSHRGTRLYFHHLHSKGSSKISDAPHGMMWSATGPMAMHNGQYIDGTARWVEGYAREVGNNVGYRHVRVDLRSFDTPCKVLVWGGRPDKGGVGARWLVLAQGLTYSAPPTREHLPVDRGIDLAQRDHGWLMRARTGEPACVSICDKLFDHWRVEAASTVAVDWSRWAEQSFQPTRATLEAVMGIPEYRYAVPTISTPSTVSPVSWQSTLGPIYKP